MGDWAGDRRRWRTGPHMTSGPDPKMLLAICGGYLEEQAHFDLDIFGNRFWPDVGDPDDYRTEDVGSSCHRNDRHLANQSGRPRRHYRPLMIIFKVISVFWTCSGLIQTIARPMS